MVIDSREDEVGPPQPEQLSGLDYAIAALECDYSDHYRYEGRPEKAGMEHAVEVLKNWRQS